MYLPDFDYYAPESVQEASGLLAQYGPKAKFLAGGTDVLHMMKEGLIAPEVLVSTKNLARLKEIYYETGKGVVIGALATHNNLVNSPVLQESYLSICETAHHMANNQVRNTGTIGGNIVNAVPSADLPPILIALGARVTLVSASGQRTLNLEDFFTGPRKTVIKEDEILTQIIIPDNSFTGSTYHKFGLRRSGALAVVGVAVAVTMEGDVCREARIALGAVAPTPVRAVKAEEMLKDQVITDQLLEEVGRCATSESKPISDIRGSAEYRLDMVRVFTKRMLRKAINEGHI
ncbi:MAG: xanthine dehydrogenase family protein subunit M [Clostridia bacterium]|jgi:carbon-monoxide dehydrogenase medium subunit|nr:xanthine dehydrogenase family protein subunit M [Clostridia bacterium]